ncbi:MAG: hypothetical protein ACR2OH_02770 [Microthrixaceae bacterium]
MRRNITCDLPSARVNRETKFIHAQIGNPVGGNDGGRNRRGVRARTG